MTAELNALVAKSDAARRCLDAVTHGVFIDPAGGRDALGDVRLHPEQIALLAYLSTRLESSILIDVGFGMGSSITIALAARRAAGLPTTHFALDPYGLPFGAGAIVEAYLQREFKQSYLRIRKRSEIGLGQLYEILGPESVGMVFIDGNHRFDNVLTDFFLSDLLCKPGGVILLDDACYPAIETVVSFIAANRPDYEVWRDVAPSTALLRKTDIPAPPWDWFRPFAVSQRTDWSAGGAQGDATRAGEGVEPPNPA